MAQMRMIDLGQVYGNAAQIQGQRQRNQLAEMMAPVQVEGAQLRNEAQGQQNRLAELTMGDQVQQTQQQTQMGDMKLTDADRQQAAYESQLFLRTLGEDFDQLPPEQRNQRWAAARQRAIEMDPEDAVLPEQFDPNAYRNIAAMASMAGTGNTNVQSTFRTDDGRLGYVTRDGRTVVTDQKVEGKFQARDYGDRPYVFNPRSGTFERVVGPAGSAAVSDADRSRYADAEADIYAARKSAEAVAGVRSQQEQREQSEQAGNTLSMLDEMETIAASDEGYYTGNLMDRGVAAMRMAGINLNDERAANTIALKQYATRLKFAAKPPGLGQMTDAEWRIIRDAIPDPATASAEELLAGVRTMRRLVQIKSGRQSQPEARPQDDQPTGQPRMRYNPETGELEPVR